MGSLARASAQLFCCAVRQERERIPMSRRNEEP